MTEYYAAGEDAGDGEEPKSYVAVNWLLTETPLDTETELALGFLDYLLLGTPAAPLRKALNDSGLGDALVGGGMDDELKQPVFSVGLKGVDPARASEVEALVLSKLSELRASGFSASAVEAALNTIEFSLRENNTGSFPRGLSLMLRAVGAWIYDRDPYTPIQVSLVLFLLVLWLLLLLLFSLCLLQPLSKLHLSSKQQTHKKKSTTK